MRSGGERDGRSAYVWYICSRSSQSAWPSNCTPTYSRRCAVTLTPLVFGWFRIFEACRNLCRHPDHPKTQCKPRLVAALSRPRFCRPRGSARSPRALLMLGLHSKGDLTGIEATSVEGFATCGILNQDPNDLHETNTLNTQKETSYHPWGARGGSDLWFVSGVFFDHR